MRLRLVPPARWAWLPLGAVLMLILGAVVAPSAAEAADYVSGEVVVGYLLGPVSTVAKEAATKMGIRPAASAPASGELLRLPRGVSVARAIASLRRQPGVAYAVPDYIAHAAGAWLPNDPGRARHPGGWETMQWNFLPTIGVDAPAAWGHMLAHHRSGGRGVVVAILDTGVAYRNWHQFRKMPDFTGTRFVAPYDFLAGNRFPLDRNGHGTFVAAEVAEATNNRFGLTGLAYGASIMPVRVLDKSGDGDAVTIARGIRYAAAHGAKVINLSLEFDVGVRAGDIPAIISAVSYAHRHGVVVVGAAGNEALGQLAYPAADPAVISVGATTSDRCRADYSNFGPRLDLVAPGGGNDAALPDPNCHPNRFPSLPSIHQMTLIDAPFSWSRFGYPSGVYGTSMAAPQVTATAALVIASGVTGPHPTPAQVLRRLERTAQPLGGQAPNSNYGYGLVDAGAATAPIWDSRRSGTRRFEGGYVVRTISTEQGAW